MFKILAGKGFVNHFKLQRNYIEPVERVVGFDHENDKPDSVQYVPILSSIKTLLHYEDVLGWIYDEQYLQTGTINKYTQGSLCQKKWSFQQFSIFLTINFVSWWFRSIKSIRKQNKKTKDLSILLCTGKYPSKISITLNISIRINW